MERAWVKVKLVKRKMLSIDTLSLTFTGKNLSTHIPGQFYLVKIPQKDHTNVSREYSIANTPNNTNTIEFGIQKVENGIVSTFLHTLKKGQEIEVKGPLGLYFNWNSEYKGPVVFIVGGSGIVPIMSMLRSLPKNKLILIASFKTRAHFSYLTEILDLTTLLDLTFVPTVTRETTTEWNGRTGRIDAELLKATTNGLPNTTQFFVCGRSEFVENITSILLGLGANLKNIQRERFG